jgi:hypothetical protein
MNFQGRGSMRAVLSKTSRIARVVAAILLTAALPGIAHAQFSQTWLGGSGNWFGNANWASPAGSPVNWVTGSSNVRAIFSGAAGTINLTGSTPAAFSTASGSAASAMQFESGGNWKLSSGTLAARNWAMGSLTQSTITLELDGIALTNTGDATFTPFNSSTAEIVLGNLAGSTVPLLQGATTGGTVTFSVGSATNFGSIGIFGPYQGFKATGDAVFSGTLRPGNAQVFDSNGYTVSTGVMQPSGNTALRTLTINGTGALATGTFYASSLSGTAVVWTKQGTGRLEIDTLVTSGTQNFNVSAGTLLLQESSTDLGNINLASGATLGGTGSLAFAATKVLTGSAGSFFTADMTAGGLDILGTLALAQSGSGVTLRLSGLLPTSGTTTLMNWTTLSTGSFATITYDTGTSLVTLTPDSPSTALAGGQVSYTAVPNSLVFIAVPEPASVCLLAGGAAILGGRELRRRRRG